MQEGFCSKEEVSKIFLYLPFHYTLHFQSNNKDNSDSDRYCLGDLDLLNLRYVQTQKS